LLPGGNITPAQEAEEVAEGVKLASCMRSRGFPGFPDPNAQDDFILNGLDTSSPQFQSTVDLCQSKTKAQGYSFSQSSAAR
jgi:hypothetical protein